MPSFDWWGGSGSRPPATTRVHHTTPFTTVPRHNAPTVCTAEHHHVRSIVIHPPQHQHIIIIIIETPSSITRFKWLTSRNATTSYEQGLHHHSQQRHQAFTVGQQTTPGRHHITLSAQSGYALVVTRFTNNRRQPTSAVGYCYQHGGVNIGVGIATTKTRRALQ